MWKLCWQVSTIQETTDQMGFKSTRKTKVPKNQNTAYMPLHINKSLIMFYISC